MSQDHQSEDHTVNPKIIISKLNLEASDVKNVDVV